MFYNEITLADTIWTTVFFVLSQLCFGIIDSPLLDFLPPQELTSSSNNSFLAVLPSFDLIKQKLKKTGFENSTRT